MYIPTYHKQIDVNAAYTLIETYPLGAWVARDGAGLVANHIPFVLDKTRGELGTLIGHVSRANTIWRQVSKVESSVVLFQGPQAYISPGWYPGKAEHGKVVPTWDYAVVHAHGVPRVVQDEVWLREMLSKLTAANEKSQPAPWGISDAPDDYIASLLRAIVGIEIPIDRIEAKLKASQDESLQDRVGTVNGLNALGDKNSAQLAILVQQEIDRISDA